MNLQIVNRSDPERQPMPLEADPVSDESIAAAKAFQREERLRAAQELGIPSDLIALYDVFGFEQMRQWTLVLTTLREQ